MRFYENERVLGLVFSSKEAKVGEKERNRKKETKRGIWNVIKSKKKKLNYYTILIDTNDVRIIMIIMVILIIDNSPIL